MPEIIHAVNSLAQAPTLVLVKNPSKQDGAAAAMESTTKSINQLGNIEPILYVKMSNAKLYFAKRSCFC